MKTTLDHAGDKEILQQSKLPFGDETQEQILQNAISPETK